MTKRKTFGLLVIFLLCTATAFAQTQPAEKNIASSATPQAALDPGRLRGFNYTHDFFGLSLSIPREWIINTAPKDVKDLVKSESEAQREKALESMKRSTVLLALTKLPTGMPDNASFMLIAERVPATSVKNGLDVIRLMKNAMTSTNFKVEFQGEPTLERINGTEFGVVIVKNSSNFGEFMQMAYVTVKNGYALELFFTYTDAADLATFDALVKTVNIK